MDEENSRNRWKRMETVGFFTCFEIGLDGVRNICNIFKKYAHLVGKVGGRETENRKELTGGSWVDCEMSVMKKRISI